MVSIKVIVGLLVLCVFSDFFATGFRFKMSSFRPRSGLKAARNSMSRTPLKSSSLSRSSQIKRTSSMGSQSSIGRNHGSMESIASSASSTAVEASKKSKIGAAVLTEVGKSVALGGTLVAANSFSSYTDSKIRQSVDAETQDLNRQIQQQEPQNRATIDCKSNEYGCFQKMCWTNCGPRLDKGDWCYATKNKTRQITSCSTATDCDPCWSCAGDCVANLQ